MKNVCWDSQVPGRNPKWVPIVSPKVCKPVEGLILSSKLQGVWVHYVPQLEKSQPHTDEDCPWCEQKLGKRWKGYLAIQLIHAVGNLSAGNHALLELTADACRACPELKDRTDTLRGKTVKVWRAGQKANSPVRAELTKLRVMGGMPPAFEIVPALYRVWGLVIDGEWDPGEVDRK